MSIKYMLYEIDKHIDITTAYAIAKGEDDSGICFRIDGEPEEWCRADELPDFQRVLMCHAMGNKERLKRYWTFFIGKEAKP